MDHRADDRSWRRLGRLQYPGTVSYAIPTDEQNHIGASLVTSTILQYHLWKYFGPEFAFNDTQWTTGERANRNQPFVGPGIVFGRFQIHDRVKLSLGIAYQVAVAPDHAITAPLTPLYNHALILSMRMTF